MAHIRRDWYEYAPPTERRGRIAAGLLPVVAPPRPPGQRVRTVFPGPGPSTWQTMGAMVAGAVLGLALLGAIVLGSAAGGGGEAVEGETIRRAGVLGVGAPTQSTTVPAQDEAAAPPTTGDPSLDRVLQQAEREGRLTPEQVAAISRAISGQPIFEDVRRLSDADVQRLADATGLPPEQLAPVLAQLVATGYIAMPSRPPAVAGAPTQPPAVADAPTGRTGPAPEAVAGVTASRGGGAELPAGSPHGTDAPVDDNPVGPPWK
jgi:hypothetical protein